MNYFRINEYISLKLEENETNIYINEERFLQCKYLLINRSIENLNELNQLQSIDELENSLNHSMDETLIKLPPEVEFWGHCSNLQIWYENDYNSKLLHRNLAFPLLKKLTDSGDPLAKKVFKEEIAKRIEMGNPQVIYYLIKEKYTNYITRKQLLYALLDMGSADIINALEKELHINLNISYSPDFYKDNSIIIANKEVIGINITTSNQISLIIEKILDLLIHLKSLQILKIEDSNLKYIPSKIKNLKELRYLSLRQNQISIIPEAISDIKKLEIFNMGYNKISTIPDSIMKLINLEELDFSNNQISMMPTTIKNLKRLDTIDLSFNNISTLPETMKDMKRLRYIYLNGNPKLKLGYNFGR